MDFDYLQMYFGEPYEIQATDGHVLTVLQPTVGDLIKVGEKDFFGTLNVFITNTTQFRLQLWDMGIDWNEISDFDLFILLYKTIDQKVADLLFDNVKFDEFMIVQRSDNGEVVLRNPNNGLVIDKNVYEHFHRYLQEMFNMKPDSDITDDPFLKEWFIDKDRRAAQRRELKNDDIKLSMQPLVSALVNHPGFKYKLQELRDIGVCEFYDSVQRLQLYEQATALLKGIFSGMIDSKNIKSEQYNWMKSFDSK